MILFDLQGCSSPVVVKFADTQKEKEQKKIQQMSANLWNISAMNSITPQYLAVSIHSQPFPFTPL